MLLGRDGDRLNSVKQVGRGLAERPPPGVGGDLGAVGMRRAGLPQKRAGLGVADYDLGALSGGVHPGDECHQSSAL